MVNFIKNEYTFWDKDTVYYQITKTKSYKGHMVQKVELTINTGRKKKKESK